MDNDCVNPEMICESFRGIVLKTGNKSDINKVKCIDITDLKNRIGYYANNIPDLPKEIKDKSVLKMVAESYHFSDDVINELEKIHG